MSGLESGDIPFFERMAVRQARVVLFYAFLIGLLLSIAQILNDYVRQKEDLVGTLDHLAASITKPAQNAVWLLDEGLATGVIEGLLAYEPILSAELITEERSLLYKEKSERSPDPGVLVNWLFGSSYIKNVPLYPPDEPEEASFGQLRMTVDPSSLGVEFLHRSFLVLASGVIRTLMLSCVLLVLFYFTLTKPVLAIVSFVDAYNPVSRESVSIKYNVEKLNGELRVLYRSAEALMRNSGHVNAGLEQDVVERTHELKVAKQSLDEVSALVMAVDCNMELIYVNRALSRVLSLCVNAGEHGVNPLGLCLYDLSPQLSELPQNKDWGRDVELASRFFRLEASTVRHEATSEFMGYTIEWKDLTDQILAEKAIRETVSAASQGFLERRLDVNEAGKTFKKLCVEINKLLDTNEKIFVELNMLLSAISRGRLDTRISGHYEGVFSEIRDNSNRTSEILVDVVREINESVQDVGEGSLEVLRNSTTLSERNAGFIHELQCTMDELQSLFSTVAQIREKIGEINGVAEGARKRAVSGETFNEEINLAMSSVMLSSQSITEKTLVVNDIAFKTNLLSLNAAVEAARAGENGRGFAVVAYEVQSLAKVCSEAAVSINAITKESLEKVESCTRLVADSGDTFKNIVGASELVCQLVKGASHESQEQSKKIEAIDVVVNRLHEKTNEVTDLINVTSGSGQRMSKRIQALGKKVAFFDLENS